MPLLHTEMPRESFPVGCGVPVLVLMLWLWVEGLVVTFWLLVAGISAAAAFAWQRARLERRRGWRVFSHRVEAIYYGQRVDGRWQWLEFWAPGGGPTIYLGDTEAWACLPAWAREGRSSIRKRISERYPDTDLVDRSAQ